ncbi:putative bifunctional diguanylate cyclase/phosphodiesterase [Micromonosporaceae bacterium Da 78-11]
MSRRAYLVGGWVVAGLALASLHLPGGQAVRLYALWIMLATCAGTVLHTVAARRRRGHARRVWTLTAAGLACWAFAEVSVGIPTLLTGVAPGRGLIANLLNLGSLVLAVAAMLIIPTAPRTRAGRMRMLLDGLMAAAALVGVVWELVLGPMTRLEGSRAALFDLAYPVLAVGVLAVAVMLFAGHPSRDAGAMKAITGGVLLVSLTLLAEVVQQVAGLDRLRPWVLDGYIAAAALMAVAPLFPLPRGTKRAWHPSTTFGSVIPYLPIGGFGVFCVGPTFFGTDPDREVIWAGAVMIAALLGRQFLAIRLTAALTRDLAEQRGRFEFEAAHDPLTGLPNRSLLNGALARATGGEVLLMIDLDGFKAVNDTLGHTAGDQLLIVIADRLRAAIAPLGQGATGARLGGDEFAVLLSTPGPDTVRGLAEEILRSLAEPVWLDGRDATVGASIGIAGRTPGQPATSLLHDADLALYEAKRAGKGRYRIFDRTLASVAAGRRGLTTDLENALVGDEFELVGQPVVDLVTGGTVAAEAVLRWHRPGHGTLDADAFRPAAAEAGLLPEIDRWTLDQAVARLAADPGLRLNLRLSERYLTAGTVLGDLRRALVDHDLPTTGRPDIGLMILVAETADLTGLEPALRELRTNGVRVGLDAFGGQSALTRLRGRPIDAIKLDPSFLRDVEHDAEAAAYLGAVIALVESLGLECVTDGVDRPAQAGLLVLLGGRFGQGALTDPPMPAIDLPAGVPARG